MLKHVIPELSSLPARSFQLTLSILGHFHHEAAEFALAAAVIVFKRLNLGTQQGTSAKYGARELKRAVGRYILNPLADEYVDGKVVPGSTVVCHVS